jgi:hypothetical protein
LAIFGGDLLAREHHLRSRVRSPAALRLSHQAA